MSDTTTPGRRTLRFESMDEIMPDVERLLEGHTTVGAWSIGQICGHLARSMRRSVDLPASTPSDPSRWVSEATKRAVLSTREMPEGLPGPPEVLPDATRGDREEADELASAIEHYRRSDGPKIAHRRLGPLTRAEWDVFQLMHAAHHLSFAVPI